MEDHYYQTFFYWETSRFFVTLVIIVFLLFFILAFKWESSLVMLGGYIWLALCLTFSFFVRRRSRIVISSKSLSINSGKIIWGDSFISFRSEKGERYKPEMLKVSSDRLTLSILLYPSMKGHIVKAFYIALAVRPELRSELMSAIWQLDKGFLQRDINDIL